VGHQARHSPSAIFFLTQADEDEVFPAGRAMASVILADAAMTIFRP
jgi:hypothetical protein